MTTQGLDMSWVDGMKATLKDAIRSTPTPELGDRATEPVEFARVDREYYVGEVGKKNGNYVYHFFHRTGSTPEFADKLGDAFVDTFRFKDKMSWHHDLLYVCVDQRCGFKGKKEDLKDKKCPDCKCPVELRMDAWSVRVVGFADNPMADDLAGKVFDKLDALLRG